MYDREPLPPDIPLAAPNTMLLPHLGFVTRDDLRLSYECVAEAVLAWLAGHPFRLLAA